jgi:hypothetical protein
MTVKEMKEFCAMLPDDAVFKIQSIEEPEVGLVDIAFIYNDQVIEIVEKMDD